MRILSLLAFLLSACGSSTGPSSHEVGAVCQQSSQCAQYCTMDTDFGAGMCTHRCTADHDCPAGSVCVTNDNGICAAGCAATADCNVYMRGFVCKPEPHVGGGSPVNVCRSG